jgi:hypothetical protein
VRAGVLPIAAPGLTFLPMEPGDFLGSAMQPAASWPAALPVLPLIPSGPLPVGTAAASARPPPAGAFPTLSAEEHVVVEVRAASVHFRDGWRRSRTHIGEDRGPEASFRLVEISPNWAAPAPSVLTVLAE